MESVRRPRSNRGHRNRNAIDSGSSSSSDFSADGKNGSSSSGSSSSSSSGSSGGRGNGMKNGCNGSWPCCGDSSCSSCRGGGGLMGKSGQAQQPTLNRSTTLPQPQHQQEHPQRCLNRSTTCSTGDCTMAPTHNLGGRLSLSESADVFDDVDDVEFSTFFLGDTGSPAFRAVFLRSDSCPPGSALVSPLHDIPLHDKDCRFRCICTTPAGSSLQHTFSEREAYNPLCCMLGSQSDCTASQRKPSKGTPRSASESASLRSFSSPCPWNVGVLPQTMHSEEDFFPGQPRLKGSGQPVEVLDISGRRAPLGAVVSLKPVAVFAVHCGSHTFCWKLVGLAGDSPLASLIHRLRDVEEFFPGELLRVREWLSQTQGSKGPATLLTESPLGPEDALVVVAQANATWQLFVDQSPPPEPLALPGGVSLDLLSGLWGRQLAPQEDDKKQQGGGKGFGRLLRQGSMKKTGEGQKAPWCPKKPQQLRLSRPPTAPTQLTSSSSGRDEAEESTGSGGHRATASVDMRLCPKPTSELLAEHMRNMSDTMVDNGWVQLMVLDGSSPSPGMWSPSPGVGSPAGCMSPGGVSSPMRKPQGLSPIAVPGASGTVRGSILKNRSLPRVEASGYALRQGLGQDSMGSMDAVPGDAFLQFRRSCSSITRSSARQMSPLRVIEEPVEDTGEGLAYPLHIGRSSSTPRSEEEAAAWGGVPFAIGRCPSVPHSCGDTSPFPGPMGRCSSAPRAASPDILAVARAEVLRQMAEASRLNAANTNHAVAALHGVPYPPRQVNIFENPEQPRHPRSRSVTVPRNSDASLAATGAAFGRSSSVGRRVSFNEEVDMVLLGKEPLAGGQTPGADAGAVGADDDDEETALHVSMPLAQDGEGRALPSPPLYSLQQIWS